MSDDALTLASNFAPATQDQWRGLVDDTLRGKPYEKAMQKQTYDGIAVDALYTKDNARIETGARRANARWSICQPHWDSDPASVNASILDDLMNGADAVHVCVAAAKSPGIAVKDMKSALDGVYLDMAGVHLRAGEEFEAASVEMLSLWQGVGDKASGSLGIDPIGSLAQTGRLLAPLEGVITSGADIASSVSASFPQVTSFDVNVHAYHAAGASEAMELGYALSTGLTYLRAMEAKGMSLDSAAKQIKFTLAADADLYLTIAKFRAARRLWASVLESCGVSDQTMTLNALTSTRMMTRRDPWVNILRGTLACFGAGVAGADGISVLPHDTQFGIPTDFARRIARNIQTILMEESNVAQVADPSAGSYALETLTADLSDKAWAYFQSIETQGGMAAMLRSGTIAKDCDAVWQKRRTSIAVRKTAITGVSEFPNIHEKPITAGAWTAPKTIKPAGETLGAPLAMHCNGEDFEALRDRAEAFSQRPTVFLANLGTVEGFTARATFAKNFFEAGGIEALSNDGFDGNDALITAFKASGAKAAVLCGSDTRYEDEGATVVADLKAAGAKLVYVAGKGVSIDADPIFMGANLLTVLDHALSVLGEAL